MKTFNPIDPFDEEIWEYTPSITFYEWLKDNCNRNTWSGIEIIDCSNQNIINLDGVENLPRLRRFNCSSNRLRTFDQLKVLNKIEKLNIDDNEITSIAPIANMKNLTEFSCRENRFGETYKTAIISHCARNKIKLQL